MTSSNTGRTAGSDERVERASVPELDAILGRRFPVLDDGFVRVIDYLGSDSAIVQAARVSYGAGTKQVREDRGLIRYLMRHAHTTPFEMCELKLHVRVPMDAWRQWIRHRTANVNEYSTRYSVAIDAAQSTPPEGWRVQSAQERQGSGGTLDHALGQQLTEEEADLQRHARSVYEHRLQVGVAREQARKDLPLSTYTEAYWKIDLHNLLHFLALRMDPHAQAEIRAYAHVIGHEIVARWCPVTWESFSNYRMNEVRLSETDQRILSLAVSGDPEGAYRLAEQTGYVAVHDGARTPGREGRDLARKAASLGIQLPWSA